MAHGNQMAIDNTAVVGVRPSPHLIAGRLSSEDQQLVTRWIALNMDAIVAFWEGGIDAVEMGQMLKPITSAP